MSRYLITGGSGFIGSHIAETLRDMGFRVRILDIREAETDGVEFIQGDIMTVRDVKRALDGVDFVLHQAAIPSAPRSAQSPMASHRANADGTLRLLSVAADFPIKRFVYASSSSIYGTDSVPKYEYHRPQPASPYAISKYCGELYCDYFARFRSVPTVVLRYFNVYGPRQPAHGRYSAVIPAFMRAAVSGARAVIYGDGEQTRDFTYVADVVKANLLACEFDAAVGKAFNIGSGAAAAVRTLLDEIEDVCGRHIDFEHEPRRPHESRHSLACIDKARSYLGYEPETKLRDGLEKTWEWFANENDVHHR